MLRFKRKSRILVKIFILILVNLSLYSYLNPLINSKNQENFYDALNGKCSCTSGGSPEAGNGTSGHWCSPEATGRGPYQNVVSYSLYGSSADQDIVQRYFALLDELAENIRIFYPGWIMRVYHKYDPEDSVSMSYLCRIRCRNPHVDLCHMKAIIHSAEVGSLVDPDRLEKVHPSLWRFLPVLDPLVDHFMSRDVDTEIIDRETAAVQQWIQSNYTFHLMRDHQFHKVILLAGLWGTKVYRKRSELLQIFRQIFREGGDTDKFTDQIMLERYMWRIMKTDLLAHDSYNCRADFVLRKSVLPTFPYPTQRNQMKDFVGNIITRKEKLRQALVPCPLECRPPDHLDWTYC